MSRRDDIAEHDREVAAKALREAADAMDADPGFRDPLRLHSDRLRTLSGKSVVHRGIVSRF